MKRKLPLHWCPFLRGFTSKAFSGTAKTIIPIFLSFTRAYTAFYPCTSPSHRSTTETSWCAPLWFRPVTLYTAWLYRYSLYPQRSYTILVNHSLPIQSTRPKLVKIFRYSLLLIFSLTPNLRLTCSFLNLSFLVTLHKICKLFVSIRSSSCLSPIHIYHLSGQYVSTETTILSYNSLFIPKLTLQT